MSTEERDHEDLRATFVEFFASRDPALRDQLIEAHLYLARHLARRMTNRGQPYEDLVQVASIGLINAVDRFDPERGVEFSTYATKTILGELKRHFRDRGWAVRAPRRVQELYLELGQVVDQLSQKYGRSPTIKELAAETGASEDGVIEALEAGRAYRSTSLDSPGSSDDGGLLMLLGVEDSELASAEWRTVLLPHLEALPERERTIIQMRFVSGMTQSDIAMKIGLSQMHVSRLLARTIETLRAACAEPE
jgi:RNA polymerase sigma-B factor